MRIPLTDRLNEPRAGRVHRHGLEPPLGDFRIDQHDLGTVRFGESLDEIVRPVEWLDREPPPARGQRSRQQLGERTGSRPLQRCGRVMPRAVGFAVGLTAPGIVIAMRTGIPSFGGHVDPAAEGAEAVVNDHDLLVMRGTGGCALSSLVWMRGNPRAPHCRADQTRLKQRRLRGRLAPWNLRRWVTPAGTRHALPAPLHEPSMSDSSQIKSTVADHVVKRLSAWDVTRVFGYPGDGINGATGALHREERDGEHAPIDFIQVAHEELAGLMAVAHAKFTGRLASCMVTGGPGAIHLLNGLYDAKLDHQPVVAIVGQTALVGAGGSAQQETNLAAILQDVASAYCVTVSTPEQVNHAIDRAFRTTLSGRCVAVVVIPHEVQKEAAIEVPTREHAHQHSAPGFTAPRSRCQVMLTWPARPSYSMSDRGWRFSSVLAPSRRPTRSRRSQTVSAPCRQGAARQGRAAGRPALRHRLHRLAARPPATR